MQRIPVIFLILVCFSVSTPAQQKMLSMEDAMVKNRSSLAPATLKKLQFVKGSSDYVYLKNVNGSDVWMRGNINQREEREFLSLTQLNQRLRLASLDTFAVMPDVDFNNQNYVVSIKGSKYALNHTGDEFSLLADRQYMSQTNADQSKDGSVAYLQNYNLFVWSTNKLRQVTTDGSEDTVYASAVHQQEFGITKGTFWSNNGKQLAFYRMDQSMIKPYPIIDWGTVPAKNKNIKYPMAGDSNHIVTVGVYNTETDKTIWLQTPEPQQHYLTNVAWSPDDKFIYIAVLNRGQNHLWLNVYDAATGAFIKTLFEETDEKYTEPLNPMLFVKNNPARFIWQSSRDGWNHLYLYNTSGDLIKQLTKGNWEVTGVKDFDASGENLFYISTTQSPLNKNLYSVNLKTGKTKVITPEPGVHTPLLSSDARYVADSYTSTTEARKIKIMDVKTGKEKTLFEAPDPLQDYARGAMQIFTIKAKDNTDLYGRLYTPVGFDSSKKYPVIVYWYGGPHAQMILNSYNGGASDYWFQYLAERGFVVFTVDTRGSDNRGKEFEQAIFRQAGEPQKEDMLSAVEYLKKQPYVDADRMGLFGWSYGGFMTTNFLLSHPGVFKAGVAGGPVMDWRLYEVMYGERYMDRPQENPEGYAKTNLITKAGQLRDHLLLIHGMQDPVVVQQHSVNFVKAAVDAGVQVDYMIYPGHEHNVLGKDRAHLYQKVTDYFTRWLKDK